MSSVARSNHEPPIDPAVNDFAALIHLLTELATMKKVTLQDNVCSSCHGRRIASVGEEMRHPPDKM